LSRRNRAPSRAGVAFPRSVASGYIRIV
jgi:hypothetical protein